MYFYYYQVDQRQAGPSQGQFRSLPRPQLQLRRPVDLDLSLSKPSSLSKHSSPSKAISLSQVSSVPLFSVGLNLGLSLVQWLNQSRTTSDRLSCS